MLTAAERVVIEQMAILRGQFSQAAAEAITGTTLMTVATLVEKALARLTPAGYCQLHELVRHYAALPSTINPVAGALYSNCRSALGYFNCK